MSRFTDDSDIARVLNQVLDDRDFLANRCMLAVDGYVIQHYDRINRGMTPADRTRVIVKAALAYLLANDMIEVKDRDRETIPTHIAEYAIQDLIR